MWETRNGERSIWRASLETPGSGQRLGFASLESLMEFLEAQALLADERDGELDAQAGDASAADS
jgi:hypothetical protein